MRAPARHSLDHGRIVRFRGVRVRSGILESLLPVLAVRLAQAEDLAAFVEAALSRREIAARVTHLPQEAGEHSVELHVPGWPAVLLVGTPLGLDESGACRLHVRPIDADHVAQLLALRTEIDAGVPPSISERYLGPVDDPTLLLPWDSQAPAALPAELEELGPASSDAPTSDEGRWERPSNERVSRPPASSRRPSRGSLKSLESLGSALIGRTLAGKYAVESLLGEGAAGAVYRARHVALEKAVAIKVMHPYFRSDPTFARRFHAEALAASRLEHPNVLRVVDFGEEPDGLLYIAMELLIGADLRRLMEHGSLALARRIDIVCQVCAALAAAGDVGIVHRDVKPENIVVVPTKSDDGEVRDVVKVLDFGLATIDPAADTTGTLSAAEITSLVGTPDYMSPEQALGQELDPRSDVYAVGVLLYELIVGVLPFEAETPEGLLHKQAYEDPPRLRALDRTIAPELEAIVERAMAKDRGDRYASARDLRAALRAFSSGDRAGTRGSARSTSGLEAVDSGFAEMFTALTAAVARTTYYERSHPEFGKALDRLAQALVAPLAARQEITFSLAAKGDAQVWVQTGTGDSVDLRRALGAGLAEAYAPRFVEVFQRRSVVSLSLREGIRERELADVVELLSGPEISAEELSRRFLACGLEHVSILFAEELVGMARQLPWQVDLCLSRLGRDLGAIPAISRGDVSRGRELLEQRAAEAVRMLTRPSDVLALAGNLDLVSREHTEALGVKAEALVGVTLRGLHPRMAARTAEHVLAGGDRAFALGGSHTDVTRALGERLARDPTRETDAALAALREREYLGAHQDAPHLGAWLETERAAEALRRDAAGVISRLASLPPRAAERRFGSVHAALVTFARRGDALAAHATLAALHPIASGARAGRGSIPALAARAATVLDDPEFTDAFATVLLSSAASQRDAARALLVWAGPRGADALIVARRASALEHLDTARPRFVAALRGFGVDARGALLAELALEAGRGLEADASLVEDVLRALPREPHEPSVAPVRRFVDHPNPGLRREALAALAACAGLLAKPQLLRALDDQEVGVRISALRGLREVRTIDAPVVARIERILSADPPEHEELRAAAAGALSAVVDAARSTALEVATRAFVVRTGSMIQKLVGSPASSKESPMVTATLARVLLQLDPATRRQVEDRMLRAKGDVKKALEEVLRRG